MPYRTPYGTHFHESPTCSAISGHEVEACEPGSLRPCSICAGLGIFAGLRHVSGAVAASPVGAGVPVGNDEAEFLLEHYADRYDSMNPVSRITQLRAAVVMDHEDGNSEAVAFDSAFVSTVAFRSAPPEDTILLVMSPAFAKSRHLGNTVYAYTGAGVSRETYEAIVSAPSIGQAANDLLIHASGVKAEACGSDVLSSFSRQGQKLSRAGAAAVRDGGHTPNGIGEEQGISGHIPTREQTRQTIRAVAHGASAPLPALVALRVPDDEGIQRSIREFGVDVSLDGHGMSNELQRIKQTDPSHGCYVDVKSPDELRDDLLLMTADNRTGCAITPDGDIVGVYNTHPTRRGIARVLLAVAAANGGKKMDCYAQAADMASLVVLYQKNGFEPVARVPFNADYIEDTPENRPLLENRPDVFVLKIKADPSDRTVLSREELEELPVFSDPENGYDQALEYRDQLLAEQERRQGTRPGDETAD